MTDNIRVSVDFLYYVLPIILGGLLSFIGLQRKFFTTRKYIFLLWQSWIYVTLSAIGSLIVTVAFKHIGIEIISHNFINATLLSLLGSATFLGIVSKLRLAGLTEDNTGDQLRTIRDFVYDFLEKCIGQKIRQLVQSKLKSFNPDGRYQNGQYFPSDEDRRFLREVKHLIAGVEVSKDETLEYIAYFDECIEKGDYVSVIRKLLKYYDLDFLLSDLSAFTLDHSKIELDSNEDKNFYQLKIFRFLHQWSVGFFLWLGFGFFIPGIFQKISPFLLSFLTKYFAIDVAWPLGIASIIFAMIVSLVPQVRK